MTDQAHPNPPAPDPPTPDPAAAAERAKADAEAKAAADEAKAKAEAEKKPPTITSISPSPAAAGAILSISGTGFGEPKDDGVDAAYTTAEGHSDLLRAGAAPIKRRNDCTVFVNGVPATHVSFWSPSLVKVHLPVASPIEPGEVVVRTPHGEARKAFEVVR